MFPLARCPAPICPSQSTSNPATRVVWCSLGSAGGAKGVDWDRVGVWRVWPVDGAGAAARRSPGGRVRPAGSLVIICDALSSYLLRSQSVYGSGYDGPLLEPLSLGEDRRSGVHSCMGSRAGVRSLQRWGAMSASSRGSSAIEMGSTRYAELQDRTKSVTKQDGQTVQLPKMSMR